MPTGQHHSKCKRKEHLQTLSCRTAEVLLTFARAQFRGAPVVAGPGAPQDGLDISWYEMIWCIKQGGRLRAVQLAFITSFSIISNYDRLTLISDALFASMQLCINLASMKGLYIAVPSSCSMKHEYLATTCIGLWKCPARFWSRGASGEKLGFIKDGDRLIPLSKQTSKQTTRFCGFHGFWSLQEFNK